MRRRTAPQRVEDGVAAFLAELGRPAAEARLAAVWQEVVRQLPAAAGCSPAGIEGGELVVVVPDGLVREELAYQVDELVGLMNAGLGEEAVRAVRLRVTAVR